jgi:hypothetical protein
VHADNGFYTEELLNYLEGKNNKYIMADNRQIKKLIIIFIAITTLPFVKLYAQNEPEVNFYRHYNGTLGKNMVIVADMMSIRNIVSGYYFYYFLDPETKKVNRYSKTIPVKGEVTGDKIVFYEFNNVSSKYTGTIDGDGNISGSWLKSDRDKPLPFEMKIDYSEGSFPLWCYTLYDNYYLIDGLTGNSAPQAKIDIAVLYPRNVSGPVGDSVKQTISAHLSGDNSLIKSPVKFMENLKTEFFGLYKKSTDGIEDFSNTASFVWDKRIVMKVLYNKNNILSIKYEKSVNTGGSHSISMTEFSIFDLKTGKQLLLTDFLKPGYLEKMTNLVNEGLREMNGIKEGEPLTQSGFFTDTINLSNDFYINNDGIGFFYNVYEIAPFSAGTTDIFISFGKFKEFIKPGVFKWVNLK